MKYELKLCPFCGEKAMMQENWPSGGIGRRGYYVQCKECLGEGPFDLGESGAAEAWNNRKTEAEHNKAYAELDWKFYKKELQYISLSTLLYKYRVLRESFDYDLTGYRITVANAFIEIYDAILEARK